MESNVFPCILPKKLNLSESYIQCGKFRKIWKALAKFLKPDNRAKLISYKNLNTGSEERASSVFQFGRYVGNFVIQS